MEIQRPLIRAAVILAASLLPVLLLQVGRRRDVVGRPAGFRNSASFPIQQVSEAIRTVSEWRGRR
jgi:hypothetical protein